MLRGPAPAASRPLVVERTIGPRTKGHGRAAGGEGSQDDRPARSSSSGVIPSRCTIASGAIAVQKHPENRLVSPAQL